MATAQHHLKIAPSRAATATTSPEAPIAIFVHDLSATGVVRNAINLANHMAAEGRAVEVVTCCASGVLRPCLSSDIPLVTLEEGSSSHSRSQAMLKLVPNFRRYLQNRAPRILFSAGNHAHLACFLASVALPKIRKVYRISNSLSHAGRQSVRLANLRRQLVYALIRRPAMRSCMWLPASAGPIAIGHA